MRHADHATTLQERLTMIDPTHAHRSHADLAAELGCSVATIRKWRRLARQQGHSVLSRARGRPATGALGSHPPEVKATVLALRQQHPGWGPASLRVALQAEEAGSSQPLPSRTQGAACLKQAGLVRRYQRHSPLPGVLPVPDAHPHQHWELDAHGATRVAGLGTVSLITIVDVVSRLKVASYPVPGTTPCQADYQLVLRRTFATYGLPEQISLDHGAVFYDNLHVSPFSSRIHLWLLALGVQVRFIRVAQTTDHAHIERTHQIIDAQALRGQTYPSHAALLAQLDARRHVLNTQLPVRVLNGQAPLSAYPQAQHSGRVYRPEWEDEQLDLERVYTYLAQGTWYRWISTNGCFLMCNRPHYVDLHLKQREVMIRFDPTQVAFVCTVARTSKVYCVPAKGLTKTDLMGTETSQVLTAQAYQLALPFSRDEWRTCAYMTDLLAA